MSVSCGCPALTSHPPSLSCLGLLAGPALLPVRPHPMLLIMPAPSSYTFWAPPSMQTDWEASHCPGWQGLYQKGISFREQLGSAGRSERCSFSSKREFSGRCSLTVLRVPNGTGETGGTEEQVCHLGCAELSDPCLEVVWEPKKH